MRSVTAVLAGLTLGCALGATSWASDLYVPGGYATIQAAIDAASPSDVIHVAAGTYHERLTVSKSLTLLGAQDGVDPTTPSARTNPALESVVDLVGLGVTNPNVLLEIPAGVTDITLSGFTFLGSTVLHYADEAAIRCWDDRITIQYNIVDGYTGLLYKGNDYLTASRNRMTATKQCLVVQPSPATHVAVLDNSFAPNATPTADAQAVYMTGTTDSEVRRNLATGFVGGSALTGSNHTRLAIAENTFTGDLKGVNIFGSSTFVTITNNTLSNCVARGLDIKGQDITITGNTINNNGTEGISIDFHVIPTQRVTITNNDLAGNTNFALRVGAAVTELVDASGNWWGTNTPAGVPGEITGTADYTPWLDVGGDTSGDPGFQGNFTSLWVDDDSPQVGAANRVQEGIDLVTASTVNLAPGSYVGSMSIGVAGLELLGPNAGLDPCVASRGAEAVLMSTDPSGTVQVAANGVTLDGIEITGGVYGILVMGAYTGLTVRNTIVDGPSDDGMNLWRGTGALVEHNLVRNCPLTGIAGGSDTAGGAMSAIIQDNCITNTRLGITGYHDGSTIRRNDVSGFGGAPPAAGISGQLLNTTISDNDVNGYTYGAGIALTAYPSRPNSANVSMTQNDLTSNGGGIYFDADATLLGVSAHQNRIYGNLVAGLRNLSAASFDASCNWWGDANGPDAPPANPNPPGDSIEGPAVFWPWWTTPTGPCDGIGPNHVAAVADTCISTVHPCETVDVVYTRADPTPLRGYSVTFQLSPELMLCSLPPTTSVLEGPYLASAGSPNGTTFLVIDNGGGSYTVDNAVLGGAPSNCGATGTGVVFRIRVKNSGGDGTGTITVTAVTARDCNNVPLPGVPGLPATVDIDNTPPAPIALSAVQDKLSNPATDPTTFIDISVPAVAATDLVKVYRKGFGNYPEYDDAPGAGSVPALPATEAAAIGAGWALAFTVAGPGPSVVAHEPPARDFWYFVAFVEDACENVGGATSMTSGTLDYHLGDVHNGASDCVGDSRVNTSDISFLGAHYAITLGVSDPLACLDVGPTTDNFVNGRPLTDNRVQFEDLILFAINAFSVFKSREGPAPASADELAVLAPSDLEPGTVFAARLWARGTGRVQGLSVELGWDPSVVEPLGVAPGELLRSQGGVAFSPGPGGVDAALVGARDVGLSGEGVLAEVRFRVVGPGDPRITIASVDARDARNGRVAMGAVADGSARAVPRLTQLLGNVPNPFNPTTRIAFSVAARGPVALDVFSVGGRHVATLLRAERDAGLHEVVWDGTDDGGRRVASGTYWVRLVARDATRTKTLVLMK